MEHLKINGDRLLNRINELGEVGRNEKGQLIRLALSDEDKEGRDLLVSWFNELDLKIEVDRFGNIFATWEEEHNKGEKPLMLGSHIDSVIDAGIYDGSYGVLSGLETVQTLKENNVKTNRPVTIAAFTNEEGVRFPPSMLGSLVYSGDLDIDKALDTISIDGLRLGDELERIGYAGDNEPGFIEPEAYIELHIEQGPVLDKEGFEIGAVHNLQGNSRREITFTGEANHAGSTPNYLRKDPMQAVTHFMSTLYNYINKNGLDTVATLGSIQLEPNAATIIPSKATFTLDMRSPSEKGFDEAQQLVRDTLDEIKAEGKIGVQATEFAIFEPVTFDKTIVENIVAAAGDLKLSSKLMTSGAGHDAQMINRIAPSAMIFVPSKDGVSHNPMEYTSPEQLVNGANVLLLTAGRLLDAK
ncbi:Zn-dependent hydrolase [Jeotgalicoccus coquinae]|uniref:N-carbamoyl-L-amino-acid hydrolase n=1 Tax=Jeotgalicoccus coquinae TaxID=709509 RepID=A0A6V7RS19_9STAP|nr:M20 family metallo-hydrolase [Jeotgalicoccus coquinae]MBB6423219.1 N-carbamoyl-L-amino-acid hydrolase [Jeotgalicoccus coquinae]GGE09734.1 Zn-dependent hydrolase [Jeotgalicoccus coquinae]CAD2081931.1 N-carbamoyl-L-amino acid hydrolase [Jeotgalicoccus coquinae]